MRELHFVASKVYEDICFNPLNYKYEAKTERIRTVKEMVAIGDYLVKNIDDWMLVYIMQHVKDVEDTEFAMLRAFIKQDKDRNLRYIAYNVAHLLHKYVVDDDVKYALHECTVEEIKEAMEIAKRKNAKTDDSTTN